MTTTSTSMDDRGSAAAAPGGGITGRRAEVFLRAQAPSTPARASMRPRPPQFWVHGDNGVWTPVVDKLSRHLFDAHKAIDDGALPMAAHEMRAVSSGLHAFAVLASKEDADSLAAERRQSQEAAWRLASCSLRAGMAASGLAAGRVRSREEFSTVFGAANWLDLDHRWRVVDRRIWFPVSGEAQRHLAASKAAAGQQTASAIMEIHKASSYLRLEAARANGFAGTGLARAIAGLAEFVQTIRLNRGWAADAASRSFAAASLALAMAHRNRALECWLRGKLPDAGYEFAAAGTAFANALGWAEGRPTPLPSVISLECAELGDRLALGEPPDRDDVLVVVRTFGLAIDKLRRTIGAADPHAPAYERETAPQRANP